MQKLRPAARGDAVVARGLRLRGGEPEHVHDFTIAVGSLVALVGPGAVELAHVLAGRGSAEAGELLVAGEPVGGSANRSGGSATPSSGGRERVGFVGLPPGQADVLSLLEGPGGEWAKGQLELLPDCSDPGGGAGPSPSLVAVLSALSRDPDVLVVAPEAGSGPRVDAGLMSVLLDLVEAEGRTMVAVADEEGAALAHATLRIG